jgi:tetratricopeptide (TPR) repeat protein
MSLSGRLKTMDLPEVIQWVAIGRKTGALSFIKEKTRVILSFKNGGLIFSRSNDPSKQFGQFLLFQGKITEQQLKHAFEIHLKTKAMLGKILIEENLVAREDIQKALKARTEEIIYDLFLWEDGNFNFSTGAVEPDELIQIRMDINALMFEGIRRKDEWVRIRSVFPDNDCIPSLRDGIDLKKLDLTPLQKKLVYFLTQNKTLSEIILELHGSDFLIKYELFQMHEKEIIEVHKAPPSPDGAGNPKTLYDKGVELMTNGSYKESIMVFKEALRLDPQNTSVLEMIDQAETSLCRKYYTKVVPPLKTPYFLIPESDLKRYSLTNEEGFIASRINGEWNVQSIVTISPLRELEILQGLEKLLHMKVIALR